MGIGVRRPRAHGVLLCKQQAKSLVLAGETFSSVCPAGVFKVFAQCAPYLVLFPVDGGTNSRMPVCGARWVFKNSFCLLCWLLSLHVEKSGAHL